MSLIPHWKTFDSLTISETKWINFVMGVLPGWWLGKDDGRFPEPYMDKQHWYDELRRAGFGEMSTFYDGYLNNNIIAMPEPDASLADTSKRLTLLVSSNNENTSVQTLEKGLVAAGYTVHKYLLNSPASQPLPPNRDIVSALDLEKPFFSSLDEIQFTHFQAFIKQVKENGAAIFWVTGSCQTGTVDPNFAPVVGVARVLRTEMSLDFALLEAPRTEWDSKLKTIAPLVLREFQQGRNIDVDKEEGNDVNPEVEWAHVDGKTLVARYHFVHVTEELKTKLGLGMSESMPVRKLEQHKPGLTSTLFWKPLPAPILGEEEVRVDVKAVGMNFKVHSSHPQNVLNLLLLPLLLS